MGQAVFLSRSTLILMVVMVCAPAELRAQATTHAPEPTAARDLPRGVALTTEDIRYASDPGASAQSVGPGWITRRVIAKGETLREPAVGRPQWIRVGEPVEVLYRIGRVEARVRGTAMGSAAEGEKVFVRIDTRRRVEGIAVEPGVVQIHGGDR